jgi:hypothetical protein
LSAVDWIFSHDFAEDDEHENQAAPATVAVAADEPGHPDGTKYKLVRIVLPSRE